MQNVRKLKVKRDRRSKAVLTAATVMSVLFLPVGLIGVLYVSLVILATQNVFAIVNLLIVFVLLLFSSVVMLTSLIRRT